MTVPTITAVRLTGAANRAELPLLVLGPSHRDNGLDTVDRVRGRADRCLRRRRVGPPGPRLQPHRARRVVHHVRAGPGRAQRAGGDPRATRPVRRLLRLRGRLGGRLRRPPAAARPPRSGLRSSSALHRREDRRGGHVGRPDRSGESCRARRSWSPGPPSDGSARASWTAHRTPGRRCCTRCRTPTTRATSRCARHSRSSTCGTSSARSTSRSWPSRDRPTPRLPRRACPRSPRACSTGCSSSSRASDTRHPSRPPARWPG